MEENILNQTNVRKIKKGAQVEGIVYKVNDEEQLALVSVKGVQTEAKIFLDHLVEDVKPNDLISNHLKEGDLIEAVVTEYNVSQDGNSIKFYISKKPILREQQLNEAKELVKEGFEIVATAKELNKGGLLLDYKGVEIFVPNSLLDRKIANKELDVIGQELPVIIIEVKEFGRKIKATASRKPIIQKLKEEELAKREAQRQEYLNTLNVGDVLDGVIVKIDNLSALVKLTDHVVGLLRISQVSHEKINKVADVLKLNDTVKVKLLEKNGNRLDLSLKALQDTPFEKYVKNHSVGDTVTGKVANKLPIGLIIELDKNVSGLLHISEFSWKLNDNLENNVNIGDELTLKIIKIENKRNRISLSKKVLEENPWKNVTLRRNDIVTGKITEVTNEFGLKVLVQGVEGVVKPSEISIENGQITDFYAVGDEIELVVLKADRRTWDLELSQKIVKEKAAQKEYKKLLKEQENDDENITIGDFFKED